jgi:glycosyltransferase involved in cell wall biosynthesis
VTLSVVTPTANRPIGFAHLERFMHRQTLQPDEWIVADGGITPVVCSLGQRHRVDPRFPAGQPNFINNVRNGLEIAQGDIIAFMEDDDWYRADHLERLVDTLTRKPQALAAGDDQQRYYNLPHRCYRTIDNVGASLCQTANLAEAKETIGIDTYFWRGLHHERWAIDRTWTVVGVKGLPGQPGLGIGHRPTGPAWKRDDHGTMLKLWTGPDDAEAYTRLVEVRAARV